MFIHNLLVSCFHLLEKGTSGRVMASTVFTAFLILPFSVKAQTQDSIVKKVTRFAADKFTEQRPFSIDFKEYGNYNFSSNTRDRDLPDGEFTKWLQFTASANVNLLQNSRWLLQANGLYRFVSAESRFSAPAPGLQQNYNEDHHYHTEGLNLSYFSKLFGKTAIYTAGFALDGSEKRIERVRGVLSGIVVLKTNETTTMSVGLAGTTDPGAQIPIAPIFIYQYKFSDKLTADLTLPRGMLTYAGRCQIMEGFLQVLILTLIQPSSCTTVMLPIPPTSTGNWMVTWAWFTSMFYRVVLP
jgi:hypothetical protein